MATYFYDLPTTGAVSFLDFCVDQSPNHAHTSDIADATQTRANLRVALKENKRTDDDEKDHLRLVKVTEEYIPHLLGIMNCVSAREIVLKSEPVFSWRTTLSSTLFNTSPRLSLLSLHADLASCLLTYAFSLSNLARSSVASLGAYEYERGISEAERKQKDEKLNFAVTLLCRASGIFSHLAESILPEWDRRLSENIHVDKGPCTNRPPDMSREVNNALAKLSLADAQSLAIRKLLTKSAYDSTVTPGPPLPKSHPSPALIAKLHLECASLYASARSLAKTAGPTKGKDSGESAEVSSDLRRYLADEIVFHGAVARKWLGVDAGEKVGTTGGGEAVGFLTWAKRELEEIKGSGVGVSREKKGKGKVAEEMESVATFLKHYKKLNDSLMFQPVPSQPDLQARIPAGRLAVSAKPYVLPVPAFGPGSVEDVRRRAEESELGDRDEGEDVTASRGPPGSYAGQGSYF